MFVASICRRRNLRASYKPKSIASPTGQAQLRVNWLFSYK